MDYEVHIRPEAEADLEETYKYYTDIRPGLGDDFLHCVDDAISKIRRMPQNYRVTFKEIRRAHIRRFPFGIFYLIRESRIIVLAVLHARRNPDSWKERG